MVAIHVVVYANYPPCLQHDAAIVERIGFSESIDCCLFTSLDVHTFSV